MNILHYWDMAGVSCILAKWQRKAGNQSQVVSKTKVHDPFGFIKFYGENGVESNENNDIYSKAFNLVKKADIIHIHGIPDAVLKFRMRGKKTILHCHGTELVSNPNRVKQAGADRIIVSTKNLLDYCPDATHMPNPVDTEHFVNNNSKRFGWLTFKIRYLDMSAMSEKIKDLPGISCHNRELDPIPYSCMPDYLNSFEGYIDIKFDVNYGHLVKVNSKTALEALSCGLKVMNWDGGITTEFPKDNRPENVVEKLDKIYGEILK